MGDKAIVRRVVCHFVNGDRYHYGLECGHKLVMHKEVEPLKTWLTYPAVPDCMICLHCQTFELPNFKTEGGQI